MNRKIDCDSSTQPRFLWSFRKESPGALLYLFSGILPGVKYKRKLGMYTEILGNLMWYTDAHER